MVDGAVPVVEYAIMVATEGRNLDDAKVKKHVVREVSPLIDDIADPTERDHFRQRLARLLKIDERALMVSSAATAMPARVRSRRQDEVDESPPTDVAESWIDPHAVAMPRESRCIIALIRIPGLLYKADRLMKHVAQWPHEGKWNALMPDDFAHSENQEIFKGWRRALAQPDVDPIDFLRDALDDVLLNRLDAVLDEYEPTLNGAGDDRIQSETLSFVLELRERRLAADMQSLSFLAQDAHENGDLTAKQYQATIMHYITARQSLQQVMATFTVSGESTVAGVQP